MAFKKHSPKRIEIDTSTVSHDSPEVQKRLTRIEDNFARFDELYLEIEAKLPEDESPVPKKPK